MLVQHTCMQAHTHMWTRTHARCMLCVCAYGAAATWKNKGKPSRRRVLQLPCCRALVFSSIRTSFASEPWHGSPYVLPPQETINALVRIENFSCWLARLCTPFLNTFCYFFFSISGRRGEGDSIPFSTAGKKGMYHIHMSCISTNRVYKKYEKINTCYFHQTPFMYKISSSNSW
jgi:hypothetical protein